MTLRSHMVVLLLVPLAACDGVGRALVDQTISTPDSGQGCGQEAICGSMLPELPVPSGAGDFGDFGDFSSCDMPNPVPIVTDTLPLGPCNCQQYEVHLGPGMTTVSWLATSLQHCVLNISADEATSVELPRATLDDVAIKLTGPIALLVRETQLVRVRIRGSATDAGAPSLALETSDAVQLAVKNVPATFDHLSVSHATLADTLLETSSAHFESVAVQRSTIKVADFDAIDVNVSESQLALERALISLPTMNNVKLTDCGSVRFVGGEIFRTESAACSELLQLYSVKVRDSWLDGPLESDLSSFENTSLGNVQKTSLLGYDTSLVRVTLCQGVERLRLSHGYVSCVACNGSLAQDPASVCSESGGVSAELDDSSCAALADVPMCENFPPRRRPI